MNKNLDKYINTLVKKYNKFDGAHDEKHALMVIKNSLYLAAKLEKDENQKLNMDMVKTIAAMHDLGLAYDRETHHSKSGEIVRKDKELREYFSEEEIEIIAKACEEHRASYKGEYTSIYSKIVSDADRMNDIYTMIERTYKYNSKHHPDFNQKQIFDIAYGHLKEKFGSGGYARYNTKYAEDVLKGCIDIINNEEEFRKRYKEVTGYWE